MSIIRNGIPWYDTEGRVVNAHGVGVLEHEGRFYLFGEYKTDDRNEFAGFACYSSPDLATWTFEGLALLRQADGLLGPERIGERPKVLRSPTTGRFVLYAHADDLGYTDPHIVVATSARITGPYELVGPLMRDGEPLRRWDLGVFEDRDGSAYLLVHEGDIHRLSDDRLSIAETVSEGIAAGGESPAMLEHGGTYWLLLSNKTSWERNDNIVLSAPSPAGPWRHRGLLAPEGTLTWNSQCSFVLRLGDGRHVYLGDRWSYPHQASAATQVWLPLEVGPDGIGLPEYREAWRLDGGPVAPIGEPVPVGFHRADAGASIDVPFTGTRVAIVGATAPGQAYGLVELLRDGEVVLEQLVDWYSLAPSHGTRWVSPPLPEGGHVLRVTATGELPEWFKKDGTRFGATGSAVDVDEVTISWRGAPQSL